MCGKVLGGDAIDDDEHRPDGWARDGRGEPRPSQGAGEAPLDRSSKGEQTAEHGGSAR